MPYFNLRKQVWISLVPLLSWQLPRFRRPLFAEELGGRSYRIGTVLRFNIPLSPHSTYHYPHFLTPLGDDDNRQAIYCLLENEKEIKSQRDDWIY